MIEYACGEDRAQDTVHVLIELVFRNFAALYGFLECASEEELVRLLHIEPGMRSFEGRVCAAPVRDDESFESEVLLKHVGKQITVLACKISVHAIVGTHDGASIGDAKSDLESAQIRLPHCPLADVCIERIAAAFLIVDRIMLQIANDLFGLDSPDDVAR